MSNLPSRLKWHRRTHQKGGVGTTACLWSGLRKGKDGATGVRHRLACGCPDGARVLSDASRATRSGDVELSDY